MNSVALCTDAPDCVGWKHRQELHDRREGTANTTGNHQRKNCFVLQNLERDCALNHVRSRPPEHSFGIPLGSLLPVRTMMCLTLPTACSLARGSVSPPGVLLPGPASLRTDTKECCHSDSDSSRRAMAFLLLFDPCRVASCAPDAAPLRRAPKTEK